ncbi:elongation factor P maturation arginine rhamnosyltransferase EarP [Pollutimonas subterranea]|uniref:Protein-arginine rhamnosyltransferase n=1 Tax=Pollutimonas subterranea TaxID=2045210 RepID=A0A2N4U8A1_9BURK|nr:elongation factor P maturation arginine rhamnosyltransferase EarP [Pollutimonas subterranea]PLC51241.1 elongation factor P maturation arginine rhamnosyltransferase EarP [Pollutimonas subterranea]
MGRLSFDIFCRVVDNYGDIGVCWRLARQLAQAPHQHEVRLWVDDLHSFSRIAPQLRTQDGSQRIDDVDIVHWTAPAPVMQPHAVVIEAFACDPPPSFIEAMARHDSLWINLEYLSAENWVESCHGLPSLQPNGLRKYFYFPGFTAKTGGLLREPGLLAKRAQWLSNPGRRLDLMKSVNVPNEQIHRLEEGALLAFLFCYPDAPARALLAGLNEQDRPALLLVPQGVYPSLAAHTSEHVHLHEVPFVDQANFDLLLWSSDLNFVRGEDSLVRALWAGKPLVWQIYAQEAGAHMDKLQAWLDQSGYPAAAQALMQHWNLGNEREVSAHLCEALKPQNWQNWQSSCADFSQKLAEYPDLAHCLVDFCTQKQRSG